VRDREAEALAALADVDELRAALDFARESYGGAANDAFSAIAELCGCKQWDYPGQLVRDVERLKAELREAVKRGNSAEEYLGHEKCARIEAELALATALQQCANGAARLAAVERLASDVQQVADDEERNVMTRRLAFDVVERIRAALATDATASASQPDSAGLYHDRIHAEPDAARPARAVRASPERGAGGAWIACSERMPVDDDSYVAVIRDEFGAVDWRLWYWGDADSEWHDEWGNKCTRDVFTHWMPIPEPPAPVANATKGAE
jgi:hypothetical protein